jgi:hypothetical protein
MSDNYVTKNVMKKEIKKSEKRDEKKDKAMMPKTKVTVKAKKTLRGIRK